LATGAKFELAIVNSGMPEVHGLLARLTDCPGIALTQAGYRSGGWGELFAATLAKPLKPARLAETIISVLLDRVTARPDAASEFDAKLAERVPLRILIAEDNPVNQKVTGRLLEKIGYQADIVADGTEILIALHRRQYDVVLMDVQMPQMDGLQATRAIRRQWPGDSGPVIIAMTANAFQEDREACLDAGMDHFLTKPVRIGELQAVLSRCGEPVLAGDSA